MNEKSSSSQARAAGSAKLPGVLFANGASIVLGALADELTGSGGHAIPADSFARAVAFAISQPDDVDINEILFRPTRQEL